MSMERLWGLLQRMVRPNGLGATLGLLSRSFPPLPTPKAGPSPSHRHLSPPACLWGPFPLPCAPLALQSH